MAERVASYSPPLRETPYVGQFTELPEFKKPWELCIQVGQGRAGVSKDGRPLWSDGFSKCPAFLVQHKDSPEAYLAHIDELLLNDEQLQSLADLTPGSYLGRFVRGTFSRDLKERIMSPNVSDFSNRFGTKRKIEILDDICVNTGDYHWTLVYHPKTHLLLVQSKQSQTVLEFDLLQ